MMSSTISRECNVRFHLFCFVGKLNWKNSHLGNSKKSILNFWTHKSILMCWVSYFILKIILILLHDLHYILRLPGDLTGYKNHLMHLYYAVRLWITKWKCKFKVVTNKCSAEIRHCANTEHALILCEVTSKVLVKYHKVITLKLHFLFNQVSFNTTKKLQNSLVVC